MFPCGLPPRTTEFPFTFVVRPFCPVRALRRPPASGRNGRVRGRRKRRAVRRACRPKRTLRACLPAPGAPIAAAQVWRLSGASMPQKGGCARRESRSCRRRRRWRDRRSAGGASAQTGRPNVGGSASNFRGRSWMGASVDIRSASCRGVGKRLRMRALRGRPPPLHKLLMPRSVRRLQARLARLSPCQSPTERCRPTQSEHRAGASRRVFPT